ncbi:hypothetical protein Tco_0308206 [Tanacetum coccineum]
MSSGNMCHGGTNLLTEKYVGPTLSLGKESLTSVPQRPFPSDMSLGKVHNRDECSTDIEEKSFSPTLEEARAASSSDISRLLKLTN